MYRAAIGERAREHGLSRFLTLTLNPKSFPRGMSYEEFAALPDDDPQKQKLKRKATGYLNRCFSKFRVYLGREYEKAIVYVQVLECHKSGMPHFHLLIDRYIPIVWIRNCWQRLGGGHQVRIESIPVRNGAAYISKYLAKQLQSSAPRGMRRITTSRHIKLFPKCPGPQCFKWNFEKRDIWTNLDMYGTEHDDANRSICELIWVERDKEEMSCALAVRQRYESARLQTES